jgi:hypothetical protein
VTVANVRIPVSPPIKGHKGPIDHIIVREPTFDEYTALGDPYIWVPLKDEKRAFPAENADVIKAYAEILVVDVDALLLRQGGFKLARAIKEAILSFFLPDAEAGEASPSSPTSSPSPASGTTPSPTSAGSKSPA